MAPAVELNILYVEDHDEIREALSSVLESEGYEVTAVASAEAGLEALRGRRYDMVLSDYSLPERSGSWMIRTAREEGLLKEVPVLIVTAHPSPEGVEGIRVIHKPLDLDDFLDEIHRTLAPVRSERLTKLSGTGLTSMPAPTVHEAKVSLTLYISSHSPVSLRALRNLQRILATYPEDQISLQVVDLSRDATDSTIEDRIAFTPTLVKRRPAPKSWLVGDFDDPRYLTDLLHHAGVERKR
jgi:two-component system response regulator GlrR